MKPRPIIFVVMLGVTICSAHVALSASNQHTLIKSLGSAKVSLQQGLTAAQRHGQPISGKFEVEDGKFQLSVYIANKEQFSEVLVDYITGKIVKSEPVTQNGALEHFTIRLTISGAGEVCRTLTWGELREARAYDRPQALD